MSGFSSTAWRLRQPPPPVREILESMETLGLRTGIYQDPYYSNPLDVPPRAKMFAGRMFTLKGNTVDNLQEFEHDVATSGPWLRRVKAEPEMARYGWEYAVPPPSLRTVAEWCRKVDEAATGLGG